jgi:arylsulfatase A-like enzyme
MVFGQLDRGKQGVYMAFDGRFKYQYSAPDETEYLTDLEADPGETSNLAKQTTAQDILIRLRSVLLQRLKADSYLEPIDNDDWRKYGVVSDRLPDEDRIFQHARWTDPFLQMPSYNSAI